MANSISLSTDMRTLYLIDSSGFSTAFPLRGNGIYLTSIVNDVVAVAASAPLNNGADDFSIIGNASWDISFHHPTTKALMIGADDLDLGVQMKSYDLNDGKVINFRLNDAQTKILIRTN